MHFKRVALFFLFLSFSLISFGQKFDNFITKVDNYLKNYVSSGLVDYTLVKENKQELMGLIVLFDSVKPSSINEKKAYLINLYNLSAIKLLADNYPVSSPQE